MLNPDFQNVNYSESKCSKCQIWSFGNAKMTGIRVSQSAQNPRFPSQISLISFGISEGTQNAPAHGKKVELRKLSCRLLTYEVKRLDIWIQCLAECRPSRPCRHVCQTS